MDIPWSHLTVVDLTHTLHAQVPTWNGSCGFTAEIKQDYSDGEGEVKFRVQKIKSHAGIGTHIDAPAHCIQGGQTVDAIPLTQLVVPAVMIDLSKKADAHYRITAQDILEFEKTFIKIPKNALVICYTGWEQFWPSPERYRNEWIYPSLKGEVAEILLERQVAGLAVDTLSPDCPSFGFPIHQQLLGAGKYIIENIAHAKKLPPVGAQVVCCPLKIQEGTEAPMRILGLI